MSEVGRYRAELLAQGLSIWHAAASPSISRPKVKCKVKMDNHPRNKQHPPPKEKTKQKKSIYQEGLNLSSYHTLLHLSQSHVFHNIGPIN